MSDKDSAPAKISEKDFFAMKARAEKLEKELKERTTEANRYKKRLEVVDLTDVEDKDLQNIKQLFLDREAELDEKEETIRKREADFSEKEASFAEREREVRLEALSKEYGIEVEKLKDADDPEKEALKLALERKSKEDETPAEDVIDTGTGSVSQKQIADMSDEEIEALEKKWQTERLAPS